MTTDYAEYTDFGRWFWGRFGKGELRCPNCGSTKMLLIRIWSKTAGVVYDLFRDGVAPAPVSAPRLREVLMPRAPEQLVFAF